MWEHPCSMLPCFPGCWFSSVRSAVFQFVFPHFGSTSDNIYIILNLCICKCSKLTLSALFWKTSFFSIILIQNMDFLGIFVDLWEIFGHSTWFSRYFYLSPLAGFSLLCAIDGRAVWNHPPPFFFFKSSLFCVTIYF